MVKACNYNQESYEDSLRRRKLKKYSAFARVYVESGVYVGKPVYKKNENRISKIFKANISRKQMENDE